MNRRSLGLVAMLVPAWLGGSVVAQDAGAPSRLFLRCHGDRCKDYQTDEGEPAGARFIEECFRSRGREQCNYYADGKTDHRIRLGGFPPDRVGARLYGDTLAVSVSCGSPCNVTTFVDLQTGFVSDPFDLVLAFDRDHKWVAFDDGGVKIASMYDRGAWCDVKRDFSSKAQAFASLYRRDFDRDGNFTFEYGRGESGETVTDVESCKGKGSAVDVYAVVLDEGKDPMFVHVDPGSERGKPLRKAGVKRPFPVVQAIPSYRDEIYRLVAAVCASQGEAEALAQALTPTFPRSRVEPTSLERRFFHRSTCPKPRKP
jgi:hypothetical protein